MSCKYNNTIGERVSVYVLLAYLVLYISTYTHFKSCLLSVFRRTNHVICWKYTLRMRLHDKVLCLHLWNDLPAIIWHVHTLWTIHYATLWKKVTNGVDATVWPLIPDFSLQDYMMWILCTHSVLLLCVSHWLLILKDLFPWQIWVADIVVPFPNLKSKWWTEL